MEPALKQRLVGAGVLVALAVIFLPMLVQGPAPDSGASSIPLSVPDAPKGDFDTQELPLVEPGTAPAGGALGMQAPDGATAQPLPGDNGDMYPAASAAGDYAVEFGDFPSLQLADAAVASLRASHLPGYREAATGVNGQAVQRVRIGPFATRPDAEAARLRASQAGGRGSLQVVVLDAPEASTAPVADGAPVAVAPVEAPKPAAVAPAAPKPAASAPAPAKPVAPAPTRAASTAPKPAVADTGFAVQLAAFSKVGDAVALRDRARGAGFSAFIESVSTEKGTLSRVRLGPVATRADAERLQAQAQAKLGIAGAVRPHP
jgi:cell division septation protein DedD